MRLSRIIMALTVGLAVAAVPTAAGAAAPQPQPPAGTGTPQPPVYPPGLDDAALRVEPPTTTVGTTVQLIGTGFQQGETVDITYTVTPFAAAAPGADRARRSDGTVVAMAPVSMQQAPQPTPGGALVAVANGPNGSFSVPFTPEYPGRYKFTAEGRSSDEVATATLIVLKKKKQPPLPVTGDSLGTPMKLGGGLVGAGAVMLLLSLAWRKRHRFGIGVAR